MAGWPAWERCICICLLKCFWMVGQSFCYGTGTCHLTKRKWDSRDAVKLTFVWCEAGWVRNWRTCWRLIVMVKPACNQSHGGVMEYKPFFSFFQKIDSRQRHQVNWRMVWIDRKQFWLWKSKYSFVLLTSPKHSLPPWRATSCYSAWSDELFKLKALWD